MYQLIKINTDFIKLGQFLKYVGLISNGSDSKIFLCNNKIYVNDILEERRGRKLYIDDVIRINNNFYKIKKG